MTIRKNDAFNDDQPRDENGRWVDVGGGGGAMKSKAGGIYVTEKGANGRRAAYLQNPSSSRRTKVGEFATEKEAREAASQHNAPREAKVKAERERRQARAHNLVSEALEAKRRESVLQAMKEGAEERKAREKFREMKAARGGAKPAGSDEPVPVRSTGTGGRDWRGEPSETRVTQGRPLSEMIAASESRTAELRAKTEALKERSASLRAASKEVAAIGRAAKRERERTPLLNEMAAREKRQALARSMGFKDFMGGRGIGRAEPEKPRFNGGRPIVFPGGRR